MGVSHNKQLITMRREINHAKYPESIFSRTLATLKSTFLALMVGCPLRTHSGIPQVKILVAEAIMYHKFTNDIEKGGDSPSHSTDNDEVVSPMYELQQPHLTTEPKMLSPSDRATSGGSARLTIAVKQASLKKKMKRAASLCMAVVLLAGGLTLFISGAVLLSVNSDSYATGMMVLGGVMVIPGIYGMTKVVKWWKKRQLLQRKMARGNNVDALIEEADNELEH